MRISYCILLILVVYSSGLRAQISVVNKKGTVLSVDSSKWALKDSNIYNKNRGSVGIGTNGAANSNAALEVNATNKGLLIPRLALTGAGSASPLAGHVAGMLVYNTATAGAAPNNVSPGFYFNNGAKWVRISDIVQADTTNDGWKEDATNTLVKLAYLSNGTTVRPDSLAFVVKDDGKVGIGVTSPSGALHVHTANSSDILFSKMSNTASEDMDIDLIRLRGTPVLPAVVQSGDQIGGLRYKSYTGSAGLFDVNAEISAHADGIISSSSNPGGLVFKTTASGALTPTDRMFIKSTGNVGIGVPAPKSKLDLGGYAKLGTSDAYADTLSTVSDRTGMIRYNSTLNAFQYHNNTAWVSAAAVSNTDTTNDSWKEDPANTQVKLAYLSDGTTARPSGTDFTIKDDGKVGIGTTSPVWQLDVQGPRAIGQFKRFTSSSITPPGFLFTLARGSLGAEASIIGGDLLGKIQFRGHIGAVDTDYATIAYKAISTTPQDGRFIFSRGHLDKELMVINTLSEHVGIGVTSPTARLSVLDSSSGTYLQLADFFAPSNTGAGNNTSLKLGVSATSKNSAELRFNYSGTSGSDNNRLDFAFNSIAAPAMSIQAGGNVGIANTAPAYKLHVSGQAHADSTISAPNYTATVQSTATGSAFTWNMNLGANAAWTLAAGANTLTINNAKAGMYGLIKVTNSGTSTLSLPAGSKVINGGGGIVPLTQVASAVDILTFYYDGANYWWTYGNNYN